MLKIVCINRTYFHSDNRIASLSQGIKMLKEVGVLCHCIDTNIFKNGEDYDIYNRVRGYIYEHLFINIMSFGLPVKPQKA